MLDKIDLSDRIARAMSGEIKNTGYPVHFDKFVGAATDAMLEILLIEREMAVTRFIYQMSEELGRHYGLQTAEIVRNGMRKVFKDIFGKECL